MGSGTRGHTEGPGLMAAPRLHSRPCPWYPFGGGFGFAVGFGGLLGRLVVFCFARFLGCWACACACCMQGTTWPGGKKGQQAARAATEAARPQRPARPARHGKAWPRGHCRWLQASNSPSTPPPPNGPPLSTRLGEPQEGRGEGGRGN